jgi:glycerate kinase
MQFATSESSCMLLLAAPATLKGVLSAREAAAELAAGARSAGADAVELPVADGGEGTADAIHGAIGGRWLEAEVQDPLGRAVRARWLVLEDGTAVVEAAAALGLPLLAPEERDPLRATSRGLGELIAAAHREGARSLLLCLGGVATVDGGAGLREVLDALPVPARVACDVRSPLLDAAYVFAEQKGATPEQVELLAGRLRGLNVLAPYAELPGAGAAGGLGAALAALGAELVPGAGLVLDLVGFDEHARDADLVVTGEGTVDRTTLDGKAPGAVVARCRRLGVRAAVFGGLVRERVPGAEVHALSGDPARARRDLRALGAELAR